VSAAVLKLREPFGERTVPAPASIGAAAPASIRVPGLQDGETAVLRIDRRGTAWLAAPERAAGSAQLNGERLAGERELRAGDVLAVGDARVFVAIDADGTLRLDVRHLTGNATLAPLRRADSHFESQDSADAEIVAALVDFAGFGAAASRDAAAATDLPVHRVRASRTALWLGAAAIALLLLFVFGVLARLQRIPVDVLPEDTVVRAQSPLSWYSRGTLFLTPGEHRVVAEREGYVTQSVPVRVASGQGAAPTLKLRLALKPGILAIDTGGLAARVTVDGAEVGRAPGDVAIPAGNRTITLRADRHLDVVQTLQIEGAGRRQELKVAFQTSWGKLAISASTPGARLVVEAVAAADGAVDGAAAAAPAPAPLPATVDLPAGLHKVRVEAEGARPWESTVLVKAGETTSVGPLVLGAPDAILAIRSTPAGAEVSIAGAYRGRTPLDAALPPGLEYDVAVALAGYAPWQRRLAAEAGARVAVAAQLQPILVDLSVRGEPADAELFVDGASRGRTPADLKLIATRHRIEVRRPGAQTFATEVDLTPGLGRTVEYLLVPEGRAVGWKPATERWRGQLGLDMRLVTPGSFAMGSERREQGRRPNETLRQVTLSRPFYIGVREVTNGEFRRFRANHNSGFADKRTIDLDGQAVSGVSWADAVQFANWASEQEGLVPAYEQKGGTWALKTPVSSGYRLPTEAEWEYAARHASAAPGSATRRYAWGDALPVPVGSGNLAGTEVTGIVARTLDGWTDDYVSVAPPGKFPASPLGLFDLMGNVSEWTNDAYASFADPAPATDPLGPAPAARHVVKGSSWRTSVFAELRLAWREGAETPSQDIGFRLARYPD
jgi:formylglycine-generating enzyme required for sulfatase activity